VCWIIDVLKWHIFAVLVDVNDQFSYEEEEITLAVFFADRETPGPWRGVSSSIKNTTRNGGTVLFAPLIRGGNGG